MSATPAGIANVGSSKMLIQKCALRRTTLPILPCDCNLCDWYIYNSTYNQCFWVLARFFEVGRTHKFSFEEIAELEGISLDEVLKIYENAINKLRLTSDKMSQNDNSDNIS